MTQSIDIHSILNSIRKPLSVNLLTTLDSNQKELLIEKKYHDLLQFCKLDPYDLSIELGIDIQTAMLALREASILVQDGLPSLLPFPRSPIYINVFLSPKFGDKVWLVGVDNGIKIVHWVSFGVPIQEKHLLSRLSNHLKMCNEKTERPLILVSRHPNSFETLQQKFLEYNLVYLDEQFRTNAIDLNRYIRENLLWGSSSLEVEDIARQFGLDVSDPLEPLKIVDQYEKDLQIFGSLNQQTAKMAIENSLDKFFAVDVIKDKIVSI